MTKKAIIIGASSGIGWALAERLSAEGWAIGITARREAKLKELASVLPGESFVKRMDVKEVGEARTLVGELIQEMGGVELIIINAGIGDGLPTWEKEQEIIQINSAGTAALALYAFEYFRGQGGGQIVGITSVLSLKGMRQSVAYSASKAFLSTYLEGLRHKSAKKKLGITVSDIRPGFVETPMTAGQKGMFWVATVEKAALQIYQAIQRKKSVAYISRKWWLIAWVIKRIPRWLHHQV